MEKTAPPDSAQPPAHDAELRNRTLVLVGMMGAGKSSVGKRLATALGLPFRDADEEIERAAGRTVSEIFATRGEAEFREGERRVIARLLDLPPHVLATGGGAFMNPETRALVKQKAMSIWLRTDPEVLARRVGRKDTRPLLKGRDPRLVLAELLEKREPSYREADLIVESAEGPHMATVEIIIAALKARLGGAD
ncbi:MAG: Shikimate kinase [Caulobacteraceae bacterium]|nr:Shikimate kinase [Caulobacteraceae bacterium]